MIYRKVVASLGAVLVLGLLGSVAGPGWSPRPHDGTLVVQTTDLAIGGDVVTSPLGTYEVESELVEVGLDGTSVTAEISSPVEVGDSVDGEIVDPARAVPATEALPGLVFVHGAGTGHYTAFQELARTLASAGVVAMVPSKRLDTYTTRERDYPAMAVDYLASVKVLRAQDGVDPDRVGVYGESEGGWIAPIAAATSEDVAFLVEVSAPVVSPRQQAAFATDAYLRNVGVPAALLRAIPRGVGAHIPGGGFDYADFNVRPYQRQVTQPTLIVYGTDDASMPTVQGAETIIEDLGAAGNDAYTVRYVADANHGIRVDGELVPEFPDVLARWINGLPETARAEPRIAGDQPEQRFSADPVEHPRWYADGDMLVAGLETAAGVILIGPLLWLLARVLRRRPGPLPSPLARWMAGLTFATLSTLAAFGGYLYRVARLALDYQTSPMFVQGGWLLVQALGVTSVIVFVVSTARVLAAGQNGRLAGTSWIGILTVAGVHVGCLVLLLVAAYWGIFPPVL